MKDEPMEVIRGSGNVFADLGIENADVHQLKALLAAEIVKTLDMQELPVRKAHALTGIAAADFSRIRNANLGRFTIDRLMNVLGKLNQQVDVQVTVRQRVAASGPHVELRL